MIKTLAVSSESLITKGGYAKQIQTKPELSEKHSFSLFYYHNVYSWYGNLALQNVIVMCNILGMIINLPHFLESAKPALDDIIEMDIRYDIDSCGIITRTKKNNGIVPWLRNILFHYRLHILLWCSHIVFFTNMNTATYRNGSTTLFHQYKRLWNVRYTRPNQMTDIVSIVSVGAQYVCYIPDSKVHGANMGPTWGRQDPGGPHIVPMNFAIWDTVGYELCV